MKVPYKAPKLMEDGFNCPSCGAFAHHEWFVTAIRRVSIDARGFEEYGALPGSGAHFAVNLGERHGSPPELKVALCRRCGARSLWWNDTMIVPDNAAGPQPNPDMPAECLRDFEEARSVAAKSPRSAAALLRVCVERLCAKPGETLNDAIGRLVKAAVLSTEVQKALDVVRVTGNDAVHPGVLDPADDAATAGALFSLVNFIAERMISVPKQVDAMFDGLPESVRAQIRKRDSSPPR